MTTISLEPPLVAQSEGDDDGDLHSYMVIAENSATAFVGMLWLNAENEQDVRELTMRWFLRTDHGVPTKYTVVPISDGIEEIVISTNDDSIAASWGIQDAAEGV